MWVPLWLYCVMLCFLPSGNVTGADDVWQHRNNQQASLRTNKQCLSHRRVGLKAHYVGFAWEPSVCVLNTSHNLKPVPSVMARINNREHRFSVDCFYHFKVDQSKSKYCHSHWKQARNNSSDFLDLKEVCCSAVSTFFLPQGSALWLLFCLSWEARHFHWCSYCWCHPSKSKHLPKYVLIQSIIFPAAMLIILYFILYLYESSSVWQLGHLSWLLSRTHSSCHCVCLPIVLYISFLLSFFSS